MGTLHEADGTQHSAPKLFSPPASSTSNLDESRAYSMDPRSQQAVPRGVTNVTSPAQLPPSPEQRRNLSTSSELRASQLAFPYGNSVSLHHLLGPGRRPGRVLHLPSPP